MLQDSKFRWQSWWWVVTFCCLACFTYCQSIKVKKLAINEWTSRMEEMQEDKLYSQQLKEELLLAVASQEDPAWIEMILMRDLGVVPEGWLKVHFKR